MFEIDGVDLPFRMLLSSDGKHAPEVLMRDTDIPTFARSLRLTVDPPDSKRPISLLSASGSPIRAAEDSP